LYLWLVAGAGDAAGLREALTALGAPAGAVEALGEPPREARYDLHDQGLHVSVTETWFAGDTLRSVVVDFLLGPGFLAVSAPEPTPAMERVRSVYREDFIGFAKTPGFLLFEVASQLLEAHRQTFHDFTHRVEQVQMKLFGSVTDAIFREVARLTSDILAFRRTVLAARDLFHALATRRSPWVNESTQPSLGLYAERMERLGDDLDSERGVLTETLNLYMGMVGHRTNRVVSRLTVFSMIFLPLSFLCGVYGMNFEIIPELGWKYGYLMFWMLVVVFASVSVYLIRRNRLVE
jgi:magnesium transporter